MALKPDTRLGTYEILGPLGSGGMGEVYRARDLRLGREVAVKVLPSDVASNAERLARFEREARAVAGLNHPNIVTIYSVDCEDSVHFLTMELVEGQDLSLSVTPGGLILARFLDLAIQIADALAAAHDRGIIHRDLKPGNVMVTKDGRVKVLDFGLAKLPEIATPPGESFTATVTSPASIPGQLLGTVCYMSPEQLRGEPLDARSDLFSLGIMLYELCSGRRPFTGRTPADVSSAILRDTPEPLTRLRPDLPADLERLLHWCLKRNLRERVQSALDVSNELRRMKKVIDHGVIGVPKYDKIASIAVLPFVNRSHNDEDEYFSDGLAEEILNMLAKIKGLRVAARASSFQFKGKSEDITQIGAKLNVAAVLDGSVRKAGDRVRISVQLVKASDGYHLWSETYDRTLNDVFAVQDDIARTVVTELRTTLLGKAADSDVRGQARADVARAAKGRSSEPEAHRLYLLGRFFNNRRTREDSAKAGEYLRVATTRDPKFALAWAELGRTYVADGNNGWAAREESFERARKVVELALTLEPDTAEAHAAMGWIQMYHDWDWRGAERSLGRALELAPGNERVLYNAGALALNQGRFDRAMELFQRAEEQDPLSVASMDSLGFALYTANRLEEAERLLRRSLELAPQRAWVHCVLSLCLLAQGRSEEALTAATHEPDEAWRLWISAIVLHARNRQEETEENLRLLIEKYGDSMSVQIAEIYSALGDADAAFNWLDKAYDCRDGGLAELKNNRQFLSLHDDRRWASFLKRVGLD